MIHSFIFSDGKLVGRDLEVEALRLVRADKGLILWVDLENPTEEEIKTIMAEAETAGVIEGDERKMISGVLRLGDRAVRGIMTPRTDVD